MRGSLSQRTKLLPALQRTMPPPPRRHASVTTRRQQKSESAAAGGRQRPTVTPPPEPDPSDPSEPSKPTNQQHYRRLSYWVVLAQAFFAGHLFSEYVGEAAGTLGPSMLPTLNARGDWVWIDKTYRRGRGIELGDIVTIRHPLLPGERASKRVIGMPGDYVLRDLPRRTTRKAVTTATAATHAQNDDDGVQKGAGYSEAGSANAGNDHYNENNNSSKKYEDGAYAPSNDSDSMMIQVPEGHVWLAGDNLPWSRDSRQYGPVPMALIRGKVTHRIWPLSQFGRLRNTMDRVAEPAATGG